MRQVSHVRPPARLESYPDSALRQVEGGRTIADVCREHGISDATYHRWKGKYGGLEVSQLRRLKQLEEENRRLKQIVGELTLDNTALKDVVAKKW